MSNKFLLLAVLFVLLSVASFAQKKKSTQPKKTKTEQVKKKTTPAKSTPAKSTDTKQSKSSAALKPTKAEQVKHEQKVRDMVAFLEYVLNMLGSKSTDASEKDILVTDSYAKIFRDEKVQIEDDLVEKRNGITNKNVQAYLKDVDFFFTDVKFELQISSIEAKENKNGVLFYKVTLSRNMKGTASDGKSISNTIPRFIEINYDPVAQDLKIVSMYTNVYDESEALTQWWSQLSYEWQTIFRKKLNLSESDSVDADAIQDMVSIDTLSLRGNRFLKNFDPLSKLSGLRSLDLSRSGVVDLASLRNLTELVKLNLSDTKISDLNSLRYSDKIVQLNLSNTMVTDLSVLEKMTALESLELKGAKVSDLSPLSSLTELKNLNLSMTAVDNLSPLSPLVKMKVLNVSQTLVRDVVALNTMKELTVLDADSTGVSDLQALSGKQQLLELHVNFTSVKDISVLKGNNALQKIYCDGTGIDRNRADAFMASRPDVLVVFNTQDLKAWWDALPAQWQRALRAAAKTGISITKEELAKVTNLDSINISDNINIQDLTPLRKLPGLAVVIAGKTSVSDLSPLKDHRKIRYLDISGTPVNDLAAVASLTNLKVLVADRAQINSISQLSEIVSLKSLYVDGTQVTELQVQEFLEKNSECLVVYKTAQLEEWWKVLSEEWKKVFQVQTPIRTKTWREDVHRLISREALNFSDVQVNDLSVLKAFIRLKELHFSGTAIGDLSPLSSAPKLVSLHAANSPVRNLQPLRDLVNIEDLDISNTPVEEIEAVGALFNLKKFNCAGTQVSDLRPLEKLQKLEYLDCSNSFVKKLDPVEGVMLKTLKCYNTKITDKKVEQFKKLNPDCQVVYYR